MVSSTTILRLIASRENRHDRAIFAGLPSSLVGRFVVFAAIHRAAA
jgi:hypothetical protein